MANITTNVYKTIDRLFSNERGQVKLTYDFDDDTGGTSDTFRMAAINSKILIVEAVIHVETAVTSAGAATVTLGAETADANAFLDGVGKATLVDDYAIDTAAGQSLVVDGASATDYISLTVGTAALTAGRINVWMSYYNID